MNATEKEPTMKTVTMEQKEDGMNAKQKALVPPVDWVDPNGGKAPNARGDRLSWEKEVRAGLADKAKSTVEHLRPQIERLRPLLQQSYARGDEAIAHERRARLEALEPQLQRWQAILKACAPWVGCGSKALHQVVAAAEAAVVAAEAPVQELEAARREIGRLAASAGLKPEEFDSAFGAIDKVFRSRLASARGAATLACGERDQNLTAIAELESELVTLRARKVA